MKPDSLITKYRPTKFEEIIGQVDVVRSFKASLKERTSHAFLFTGPKAGIGKTTLARIGASYLGAGPGSITEIDAATYSGADDMRDLTATLNFRPFGKNACKVFIVDECHVLSGTAWKALLKHVEEPPAWGYWFFCTTDLAKVPDTITSRCACYRLKEVARKELIDFLDEIVELEGFDTPSDIVQLCATSADGSPRRALSNLAVCYAAKNRAEAASLIADDEVKDGGAGFELAKALSLGWSWTKIQPILAKIKDDGESPESVRHTVRSYFATVIVGQKDEKAVCKALKVLENFSDPFVPTDGISPIVLAVGRSIF